MLKIDLEALRIFCGRSASLGSSTRRGSRAANRSRVVELRAVDHATLERRHDSPPGENGDGGAHLAQSGRRPRPTVRYLRPLKSSAVVTGFLNQPSGWHGNRAGEEADEVELEHLADQLVVESRSRRHSFISRGSCWHPSRAPAACRTARRPCSCRTRGADAVAAIEMPALTAILHLEGGDHRAGASTSSFSRLPAMSLTSAWRNPARTRGRCPWSARSTGISGPGHVWARLTCGIATVAHRPRRRPVRTCGGCLLIGLEIGHLVSSTLRWGAHDACCDILRPRSGVGPWGTIVRSPHKCERYCFVLTTLRAFLPIVLAKAWLDRAGCAF